MEMVCDGVLRRDFVGGLVTYFIYTTLLVGLYILWTTDMAAQRYSPNPCFLIKKIKNTMVGLIQRRPTTFRRTGEMSR